ncbi:DUF5666 domain-containing protein [Ruegeria atlantica]|uniref:DUF5666 domain-containing protein n=1 Tax=Ruegeria atlantica TaxID=81569 RepID=UPI00147C4F24|nr:DUF5666 domain-containing protein [Ruegeria atlantica]
MGVFLRLFAMLALLTWLSVPLQAEDKGNSEREGGIIGTGIVGTITHLGSIHVNGQRILFDDQMPVANAVPPIRADELKPGHTVAIVATYENDEWHARHIRQVLPLVGPVSSVQDGQISVLGTDVTVEWSVDVQVGDWVAISGLWRGHKVRASRVEKLSSDVYPARLSGTYLGSDPQARTLIGASVISGIEPQHLSPGDLVRVIGQPTSDGIRAERLEAGLFAGAIGVVQVQGFYSEPQPSGLYTVLGSGLIAFSDQPEMIDQNTEVIRCGDGGELVNSDGAGLLNLLGC